MQKPRISELIFFWVLFGISAVLAYLVFAPYFTPLFLGLVFAILLFPVYARLSRSMKGRTTLSALATTLIAFAVIIVPLFLIGLLLTQEAVSAYGTIGQNTGGTLVGATDRVNTFIARVAPSSSMHLDLATYVASFLQYIVGNLNTIFLSAASILFNALLMLFAMFFFLRDGQQLKRFITEWSPLSDKYDENIMDRLSQAVSSVVKGTLVSATLQGLAAGLGFLVFGVPGALLWGMLAVFAALVPIIGTGLITFPAAGYLMLHGHLFMGIGLLAYALILVSNIDTLVRPMIIKRGLDIHPLVVLLSVIGGLSVFGPVGFIVGPVVIALFFVLLELYPELVRGKIDEAE